MNRRMVTLAVVAVALALPSSAFAQRRYWNTPPMTPFGPQYDPATYRQAGGDPVLYDQIMQQKIFAAQQKALAQQQQMLKKMQEQQKKAQKGTLPGNGTGTGTGTGAGGTFAGGAPGSTGMYVAPRPARKKHRTKKATSPTATAAASKPTTDKDKPATTPAAATDKPTGDDAKPATTPAATSTPASSAKPAASATSPKSAAKPKR